MRFGGGTCPISGQPRAIHSMPSDSNARSRQYSESSGSKIAYYGDPGERRPARTPDPSSSEIPQPRAQAVSDGDHGPFAISSWTVSGYPGNGERTVIAIAYCLSP